MKPEQIQKHLNTFHNLLIDILRRRELLRIFEENLKGKASEKDVVENWFVSFYTMDYTRGQLVDLRKFFETSGNSYKIKSLTGHLGDKMVKKMHKEIFRDWKQNFEKLANKLILHIDQDTEKIKRDVSKKELDWFINDVNNFFDKIVDTFHKQGNKIIFDKKYRDLNGEFLKNKSEEEFDKYLKIVQSK